MYTLIDHRLTSPPRCILSSAEEEEEEVKHMYNSDLVVTPDSSTGSGEMPTSHVMSGLGDTQLCMIGNAIRGK